MVDAFCTLIKFMNLLIDACPNDNIDLAASLVKKYYPNNEESTFLLISTNMSYSLISL
jgi:hypothetical protein